MRLGGLAGSFNVDLFLGNGEAVCRRVFLEEPRYAGIQKPSFSCSLEGDAGIDHRLLAGPEGRSRVSNLSSSCPLNGSESSEPIPSLIACPERSLD
jgi:hypothetical protein